MSSAGSPSDRRGAERVTRGPNACTILVVDDSTAIRRILRRALEPAGYRVTEACDGEQALIACRHDRPELVLLDIDMPVMDGPAALAAMRNDAALASLPVLFLTARTGGDDVAAGLDLGAEDYLRKPCDPAELTARVGMVLRRKTQEAALAVQAAELDLLTVTDVLTGLGNRRRIELRRNELAATLEPGAQVGVLIIDIDHFKKVNDEHGHLVGDLVLRIVAARLGYGVTPPALLARWGGEEFLVLAPGLGRDDLVVLGDQLRRRVGDTPCAVDPGEVLEVTVSVGCSTARLDSLDATIESADKALYEAKRSGRNRVCSRRD